MQADPLPALHSLITGLRRDLDAVIAGLRKLAATASEMAGALSRHGGAR